MPEILETDQEALEAPITPEELAHVIKKAKTGRAQGPDGLPLQNYKVFAQDVKPKLLKALNSIQEGATPTAQFTSANITLLLKEAKEPTLCPSYRSISVLNTDIKLLASALAL
ncbi:Hypothetical predicted protein [Pelobates cultripes]|uniref:Reverse transcriptase domain-containing protein n=1 Tax=Pelobates cultripes TaxID=61616 RepID=A0AAD1R0R0_PELCU|nr:Hypothetical predicted protein [Pelobates cultripes]